LTHDDKLSIVAEVTQAEDGDAEDSPFSFPESITPDWVKATIQLDPSDDEAEQRLRDGLDREFERELAAAFAQQLDEVLPPNATDDQVRQAVGLILVTSAPIRDVLRRYLLRGATLGVSIGEAQVATIGMGFDWTLPHTQAAEWASQYAGELITRINETTRNRVQIAVSEWFNNGDPLDELRKELEPLFGRARAQMIAQTETTIAAAEGNNLAFAEAGIERWTWATARDERVCNICGPLEGVTVVRGEEFAPGITKPAAHPRCRCWTRPFVEPANG
jgi:SPP1 gp7 family putative phage head morphogenesis protein